MSSLPESVATFTPAAAAPVPGVHYAGLATRAISFVLDAAVINLLVTIVGVAAALILSVLHLPQGLRTILTVIGAIAYVVWLVGYFVVFWSTTGQTPGARVMQIRVLTATGATPGPGRALVRCAGLVLAVLPLFAGFAPVLFDDRRRALQDQLAHTVVVDTALRSTAGNARVGRIEAYAASRRRTGHSGLR
jgi:uncharacterized RDD family membrane protein YckC